ncbi:porin family protein [Algoriphagus kandeliae]|uniref:Porin family protein n=1 Tax=Algoriphagus kandeliae TaxID=2562278 RepID=A0A4Y9QZ80_9BACT|nr:outer membrane beta-barrel protein [Algoriphagus kandeliae]TFV97739.1 porin family protein [Algoriphagus kandeliae]
MKKLIALVILLSVSRIALSQEIRLNTYGGYIFKNTVNSYYTSSSFYEGTIQDGFRWGAGIEYYIQDKGGIEIQYLRQNTNVPTRYADGIFGGNIQFTDFDLGVNYVMINGTRYFSVSEKVEPFAGAGIGLGIFSVKNPDNGNNNTATKLSWNIRGGANLWLAENVALRVQASLFSAVEAIGGGLYFGTGGSGAGLSTYSTMYQFGLEGGLVFRIPQK